ncbi:protein FAM161A-like [Cololabis saira]|uniref:protein FAM161A-like n=1 Tax=Cololabis saira TaxID=129043 RepID=UPI002AD25BBD|nr:protein FAM161A-like [Cololabis saira]
MYRSSVLENKELVALYGAEGNHCFAKDEDFISEECDLDCECSEDGKGGRGIRSSVSLEIYGLQREERVRFSNQDYCMRLEALKNAHLRNVAELERMYVSQGKDRPTVEDEGSLRRWRNKEERQSFSGPSRRLQRINSQEELDFHETSSGSDQSEVCGEDGMGELGWTPSHGGPFARDTVASPDQRRAQKHYRFKPKTSCLKPQGRASCQSGARVRSNKVTVPKPFQMMLREEERKRHKVRTRSELELENTLLRQELEELRECQKKFRASPAPAHIHVPLYEMISRRHRGRSTNVRESCKAPAGVSPQPFHFLERERRKREAKIIAELGNFGRKEERQAFKARAMPSSVYGTRSRADSKSSQHQPDTFCMLEREVTDGQSDQSSDLEDIRQLDTSPDSNMSRRSSSSKSVKKQIELSIEMVKERKWSYVDPLMNICSSLQPGGSEPLLSNTTDYISV